MSGSLVPDLGISPEVWLFITFVSVMALFFKFNRVWSIRNLDLLLLFTLSPGFVFLTSRSSSDVWTGFSWLFGGSFVLMIRCFADLGLPRRPLLEPNLNVYGLNFLVVGVLLLLMVESARLPMDQRAERNPAESSGRKEIAKTSPTLQDTMKNSLIGANLPPSLARSPVQEVVSRILACSAHVILALGMIVIGWKHFRRSVVGVAAAACYALMPYTRIAVADSGQLVSAALVIWSIVWVDRPLVAAVLLGLATGWIPACIGLLPLWSLYYRDRAPWHFLGVALATVLACVLIGALWPSASTWATALGARSLSSAGMGRLSFLMIGSDPTLVEMETDDPVWLSFWSGIDPSYRLPVLIMYFALVVITSLWPARKTFSELIALSAALLIASQFWYLDRGGTLVLLYLPLVLIMIFRSTIRPPRQTTPSTSALSSSSSPSQNLHSLI